MSKAQFLLPVALLMLAVGCNSTTTSEAGSADPTALILQPINTELDRPWGMDFLNEQEVLVTQKGGQLLWMDTTSGETRDIGGLPVGKDRDDTKEMDEGESVLLDAGQGGLLDVAIEHTVDGTLVYLSYSHFEKGKGATTRVIRGRLVDDFLEDVEVLFTAQPYYKQVHHYGSRLLLVDDYLFITVGDRGNRDYAQDVSRHNGKVMRLHKDGRIPFDNPFVGRDDALPEIWTYGHRNPQGMDQHPDGSIWVSEHGPKGGDELNRLEPGTNYGWPIITYGEEYRGGKIGEGTEKPGMAQPIKYYLPSIATSGISFNDGERYPGWSDSVLVGALVLTHLNRVELDGDGIGEEFRYFESDGLRIRDVQTGPDGYAYVLAGDGLYRVTPGEG